MTATLTSTYATELYLFIARAGDLFFFAVPSRSSVGSAQWALVDPFGNLVFDRDFGGTNSDSGPTTLPFTGTYTLLIEGSRFDTGAAAGSYSFTLDFRGNDPVTPPLPGTPLVLNTLVTDSIGVASEQDRYSFTLSSTQRLYFDSQTNNDQIRWNLAGPSGTLVSNRAFTGSDAIDGNPFLVLGPGDYFLTVFGN